MKLNAPRVITFIIALVLAVAGLVFYFVSSLKGYALWPELVGFVVLALGNLIKGL